MMAQNFVRTLTQTRAVFVRTRILWTAVLTAVLVVSAPAAAQEELSEARLRKIEAEIRALQRNVFPGGNEKYFEPQIQPDADAATQPSGPSTTAVTDILARLDAMEQQLQRLTAITEENVNAIGLLSERLDGLESGGAPTLPIDTSVTGEGDDASGAAGNAPESALVNAPESAAALASEAGAEEAVEEIVQEEEPDSAMGSNLAAMGAAAVEEPDTPETAANVAPPVSQPTPPSPERLAAVRAITKPQTSDAGDDEYSYGFRLWNAGFYPEARQQLSKFVEAYPDHRRATYGRNLLGRAYLDDGKPEDAARWFLRNYQEDRTAARAPDSLLFLAESMIALDDTRRACIALAEFGETYPAVATGRLLEKYQANRARVTCEG